MVNLVPYTLSPADTETLIQINDAIKDSRAHPQIAKALKAISSLIDRGYKPEDAFALKSYVHKNIRQPLLDIYTFYAGLQDNHELASNPIAQEKFFPALLALAIYWPLGNDGIDTNDFLPDEIGIFFSGHIIKKQTLMAFWEKDRLELKNLRHPFTYQLCTARDISFNINTSAYIKHYGIPEAEDKREFYKASYLNIYYPFASVWITALTWAITLFTCALFPPVTLIPILYVMASAISFIFISSLVAYGLGQLWANATAKEFQQQVIEDSLASNQTLMSNLDTLNTRARDFLNGVQISRLHATDILENLLDPTREPTPTLEEKGAEPQVAASTQEQTTAEQASPRTLRRENFLAFFDRKQSAKALEVVVQQESKNEETTPRLTG
jgi:hypothetical protein